MRHWLPSAADPALTRRQLLAGVAAVCALTGWGTLAPAVADPTTPPSPNPAISHTDAEWRQLLTPDQYRILRQAGTETPYSSPLNNEHRAGVFSCAGCGLDLFSSATKFDSGTGWPSFWQPLPHTVSERPDNSLGISRTEVLCGRCAGHLGHVFDDGPKPTGLRYCINGAAMSFRAT
ncbi:peptide-methionine (R)-S-oxide reductase MsrB [Mycobacteroides sp. LB1]|uniref:peptide-methionine (R)-S-oxide reductase MsrB n=1 Tax=Mycobacteroides sp. LB1 TaxID=2750814 RepID=UPI0015DDF423|nr:peptide-methionine (R)-S-oxide reductase MsrB [Mycobacteroides sp. LB1]